MMKCPSEQLPSRSVARCNRKDAESAKAAAMFLMNETEVRAGAATLPPSEPVLSVVEGRGGWGSGKAPTRTFLNEHRPYVSINVHFPARIQW
jgi:hypothetical protein